MIHCLFRVSFPAVNLGPQLPTLLPTEPGNDPGTSIVDLERQLGGSESGHAKVESRSIGDDVPAMVEAVERRRSQAS